MMIPQIFSRILMGACVLGVCLLGVFGCASQPALTPKPDAPRSYDGLVAIETPFADRGWARTDIDLQPYRKVMFESAGIVYRQIRTQGSDSGAVRRGKTEFPVSLANREEIRQVFADAFRAEIAKIKRYEVTDTPGPDVLMVRVALLDVVSNVPQDRPGRVDVYLETVGSATLVVELVDSESGSVLLRALDRRSAKNSRGVVKSSSVANTQEVRKLANSWASLLRTRLEALADAFTLDDNPTS